MQLDPVNLRFLSQELGATNVKDLLLKVLYGLFDLA
jgi:hypothetical protein